MTGLKSNVTAQDVPSEYYAHKYSLEGGDGIETASAIDDVYDRANPTRPGFTKCDQKDMWRMGKLQELKRNYRPLSALSFAVVLCAVWEYLLIANTQGLKNGGLAGLWWSYVWTFVGFGFVEMSLAEMASMAPISGGQYHWVSEFAPPHCQQFLSYMVGWMSTLSWQAGNASGSFLTGTIIQALIKINHPSYQWQNWHGTLLMFSMVAIIYVVNIWFAQTWPKIQNGLFLLHVLAFAVVVSVLWIMSPHQSAKAVWTQFQDRGGWGNVGVSVCVGQITAIYSLLGSDATAHMAEEVRDASRYVPISLFWSYFVNGIMAIIFLTTYVFCIPDVDDALNDESDFPFLYVFKSALSTAGVNGLTSVILILVTAANVSFNASTARQTFAFARDKGLPWSRWTGKVDAKKEIPANAITLTCVITIILALINIGSDTAFLAVMSLQVVALMSTYMVSISCVLYRRIFHPDLIPKARWSLGRYGVPVNIVALCYCLWAFFWSFWPEEKEVDMRNFNWSSVMWAGVLVVGLIMYRVKGKKVYTGPVAQVRAARMD